VRLLTPHEYGVVAAALIAMDFAAMIYGLGLSKFDLRSR
jgi:hypothetical protein